MPLLHCPHDVPPRSDSTPLYVRPYVLSRYPLHNVHLPLPSAIAQTNPPHPPAHSGNNHCSFELVPPNPSTRPRMRHRSLATSPDTHLCRSPAQPPASSFSPSLRIRRRHPPCPSLVPLRPPPPSPQNHCWRGSRRPSSRDAKPYRHC